MRDIVIHNAVNGSVLYSGRFITVGACLAQAAEDGVNLSGADLRRTNLSGANLDGLLLKGARLDGANLSGVNLSEACLDGSILAGAALQNACLCFSSLMNCDFTGAQFGATDIAGARIDGSRFSTLSALTLNFRDAGTMEACLYSGEDGQNALPFSTPPLVLTGLAQPVAIFDRHLQIGQLSLSSDNVAMLYSGTGRIGGQGLYPFLAALRKPLQELLRYRGLEAGQREDARMQLT